MIRKKREAEAGPKRKVLSPVILVLTAVVLGLALRLFLIWAGKINSDEAIVGLMGMEILKGKHFAFYWGQPYMGSLEAYGAALLFLLFGISIFSLKMVPFLFFLVAACFNYLFVKRLFGREIGLISLGLLFFSPAAFTIWTISPRGGYMEVLAFGSAALYLAAVIWERPDRGEWGYYLLLGLISGIGFWTHYLFVFYLIPLGLLVILPGLLKKDTLKRSAALAFGFLVGVSPVIVYNLRHSMASMDVLHAAATVDLQTNFSNLFGQQVMAILGVNKVGRSKGPLWAPLSWTVLIIYIISTLYYLLAVWRGRQDPKGKSLNLLALPPAILVVILILSVGTGYGKFNTQRYLLPSYPIFILFLSMLIRDVHRRWRWPAAGLLVLVLTTNVFSNWEFEKNFYLSYSRNFMEDMDRILQYCRDKDVRTAYSNHWNSYTLTFLSRQELVVGDVEGLRYEPFERLVAESPHPAIIWDRHRKEVASTLKAIGYRFGMGRIGGYTVFANPRLPAEIDPSPDWREAWIQDTGGGVFDQFHGKGVISPTPSRQGMSVTFSLSEKLSIGGILLSPGDQRSFYPRSFQVSTSSDGLNWDPVKTVDHYSGGIYHRERLRFEPNGMVSILFPPREAHLVKVTLKKRGSDHPWAVGKAWISAISPADD